MRDSEHDKMWAEAQAEYQYVSLEKRFARMDKKVEEAIERLNLDDETAALYREANERAKETIKKLREMD